ncbi:MAG TPA: hypothetical protein VF707_17030 [Ardenticatenaceae bacterium]|jgi:hypothetical protein
MMSIKEKLNRFWELWHQIEASPAHHANWLDWFDEREDGCGVHGIIYGNDTYVFEDELLFRFRDVDEGIERLDYYLAYPQDVEERLKYLWELWDEGVRALTQQVLYPEGSRPGVIEPAVDESLRLIAA